MMYKVNNSNLQLGKKSRSNLIKSTLSFFKPVNKSSCIIINPGKLSEELYFDSSINSLYDFYKFPEIYSHDNLEKFKHELIKYDYILFDHSGDVNLYDKDLIETLNLLKLNQKKVFNLISFFESVTGRIPLIHVKNQDWFLNEDLFFVSNRWHFYNLKRIFDVLITLLFFPLALFFTTVGMILIKFSSPGPVMFKQNRVGKNGKQFTIYKLRTMIFSSSGHNKHTVKDDNRIFPVGKFLRLTKIDELPQLINVLKGEMSLVGPRPEKVDIVQSLSRENPYYPLRHLIKPGITGWAQVNNPTATPNENLQKLEFDLFYLKNASYLLEFIILIKTIKVVLKRQSL
jgi:lipopolysaccharide/colanic/teichoic acid biosynthesis glycosyltransferase